MLFKEVFNLLNNRIIPTLCTSKCILCDWLWKQNSEHLHIDLENSNRSRLSLALLKDNVLRSLLRWLLLSHLSMHDELSWSARSFVVRDPRRKDLLSSCWVTARPKGASDYPEWLGVYCRKFFSVQLLLLASWLCHPDGKQEPPWESCTWHLSNSACLVQNDPWQGSEASLRMSCQSKYQFDKFGNRNKPLAPLDLWLLATARSQKLATGEPVRNHLHTESILCADTF